MCSRVWTRISIGFIYERNPINLTWQKTETTLRERSRCLETLLKTIAAVMSTASIFPADRFVTSHTVARISNSPPIITCWHLSLSVSQCKCSALQAGCNDSPCSGDLLVGKSDPWAAGTVSMVRFLFARLAAGVIAVFAVTVKPDLWDRSLY